ncbi:MAG: hypothetical protein IKO57_05710 [Treponema sp.]|nr:hypothetical protein [Treponema sp.]
MIKNIKKLVLFALFLSSAGIASAKLGDWISDIGSDEYKARADGYKLGYQRKSWDNFNFMAEAKNQGYTSNTLQQAFSEQGKKGFQDSNGTYNNYYENILKSDEKCALGYDVGYKYPDWNETSYFIVQSGLFNWPDYHDPFCTYAAQGQSAAKNKTGYHNPKAPSRKSPIYTAVDAGTWLRNKSRSTGFENGKNASSSTPGEAPKAYKPYESDYKQGWKDGYAESHPQQNSGTGSTGGVSGGNGGDSLGGGTQSTDSRQTRTINGVKCTFAKKLELCKEGEQGKNLKFYVRLSVSISKANSELTKLTKNDIKIQKNECNASVRNIDFSNSGDEMYLSFYVKSEGDISFSFTGFTDPIKFKVTGIKYSWMDSFFVGRTKKVGKKHLIKIDAHPSELAQGILKKADVVFVENTCGAKIEETSFDGEWGSFYVTFSIEKPGELKFSLPNLSGVKKESPTYKFTKKELK